MYDFLYDDMIYDIYTYKDIDEYNLKKKKSKILIIFEDMIVYKLSNKKFNPIVTELFTRGRKLNISLVFVI